jgi:hypothetical protein
MSPEGLARLTISRQSDYSHATLGFQLTNRLYLGLRQTSESKKINSETLHLYTGIDAKLMLYKESRFKYIVMKYLAKSQDGSFSTSS